MPAGCSAEPWSGAHGGNGARPCNAKWNRCASLVSVSNDLGALIPMKNPAHKKPSEERATGSGSCLGVSGDAEVCWTVDELNAFAGAKCTDIFDNMSEAEALAAPWLIRQAWHIGKALRRKKQTDRGQEKTNNRNTQAAANIYQKWTQQRNAAKQARLKSPRSSAERRAHNERRILIDQFLADLRHLNAQGANNNIRIAPTS